MLFADFPLAEWKTSNGLNDTEPWASFERARACLAGGPERNDVGGAIDALSSVADNESLESRQILEAWCCLRAIGVSPPPRDARRVYGVVLEVPVDGGLDLLAAYADHSARYINHAGNVIIWDTRGDDMDESIDDLLRACRPMAESVGPWVGKRPDPPQHERVRLNVLTPSGLRVREGTFAELSEDTLADPAITAGVTLLQLLTQHAG